MITTYNDLIQELNQYDSDTTVTILYTKTKQAREEFNVPSDYVFRVTPPNKPTKELDVDRKLIKQIVNRYDSTPLSIAGIHKHNDFIEIFMKIEDFKSSYRRIKIKKFGY